MAKKTTSKNSKLKNFIELPVDKLVKAEWNYKTNDPELDEKLINNIKRNGQIENIIVRELDTGYYEVVNGNHRLNVLDELGFDTVVCYNLGSITEQSAQRIAIETNETKFEADNIKLAGLIKEISTQFPIEELAETMPYTEEELEGFSKLLDFDWDEFSRKSDNNDVDTGADDNVDEGEITITYSNDEEKEQLLSLLGIAGDKEKYDFKELDLDR